MKEKKFSNKNFYHVSFGRLKFVTETSKSRNFLVYDYNVLITFKFDFFFGGPISFKYLFLFRMSVSVDLDKSMVISAIASSTLRLLKKILPCYLNFY